jgi:hypothetical protein
VSVFERECVKNIYFASVKNTCNNRLKQLTIREKIDKDRQREIDREKRQRDRETERQRDRETEKQRDEKNTH